IEGDTHKYQMIISMIKRLGYAIYGSILVIGVTGTMLGKQNAIKNADPMLNTILTTKWAVWGFLLLNVVYVTYRLSKTSKSLQNSDYVELHENLIVTVYYFIPLNIAFALFAAYLGVSYREF
ncbi:3-isopropylmalate dehydratase, partial [Campylobacter rectus]